MASKTEIGSLAIKLSAESSEFDRAVNNAQVKLHELAKTSAGGLDVKGLAGMGLGAAQNPMGALLGGAGGAANMLGGAVGGPIGAAIGGLKGGLDKLWATVNEVGQAFHEATKKAEEFGVSTRAMAGLSILAKDRADEMEGGLRHLQRAIGEAATGSKEAQAKFAALGIDWKELAAVPLDVAFGKVNDQLKKQGSLYATAAGAREIYGREGQKLIRMIEQGSKGVDAAELKALDKGIVPDAQFTKSYEEYLAAKKDLDRSWQGLKGQFASTFGTGLMNVGANISRGASDVMDAMFGHKSAPADLARQRSAEMAKAAAAAKAQQQSEDRKFGAMALMAAQEESRQLQLQVAAIGDSAGGAKVLEVRMRAGAEAAEKLSAALRGNDALKQLVAREGELDRIGKQLAEETATPFERYQKHLADIQAAYNRGKISAEVFGRAALKAIEDLDRAYGDNKGPLQFLQMGSQADRSFGLNLQREQKGLDLAAIQAKALAVDEQINAKIGQAVRQLEQLNRQAATSAVGEVGLNPL